MFRGVLGTVAALSALLIFAFLVTMLYQARTAFSAFRSGFLTGTSWDPFMPTTERSSSLSERSTTFIAMLLAVPIGIGCASHRPTGRPDGCRRPLDSCRNGGRRRAWSSVSGVYWCWHRGREDLLSLLAHLTGGHGPFSGPQIGVGLPRWADSC